MLDKVIIQAPAKINLFFRVINRRDDGYHNIKSGITFINLFDEIKIRKSNSMSIKYSGPFKPSTGFYKNCIIHRTLKFLNLHQKINLEINIKKNIPVQAGLGSASTNAAAFIKGLEKLGIIKQIIDYKFYSSLGADVPVCLYGKNALVKGIGEKISRQEFPKYFFLVVKPEINFSTKQMYEKISKYLQNDNKVNINNISKINEEDNGNDFENIAKKENDEINQLLFFLSNSDNCIFAGMTGSGSCCFATFEQSEYSKNVQIKLKNNFPKLWSFVGENNIY